MLALVAALAAACDVAPPGASPDCRAFAVTVQGTSVRGDDAWTLVYVLDPSIRTILSAERAAAVERGLVANLEVLVTGDRDRDGTQDFLPPRRLRAIVLDATGEASAAMTSDPPALGPGDGPARVGEAIEVWPGERGSWDAWFIDTGRARLHEALARDAPPDLSLFESARSFLHAHPEHTSRGAFEGAQLLVVLATARDDESTLQLDRWDVLVRYRTTLGIVAAFPEDVLPPRGSSPHFADLLARQSFDETAVPCRDGSVVGRYPRGLLQLGWEWSSSGGELELSSPCSADVLGPLDAVRSLWGWSSHTQACLPRPLPLRADLTVDCTASVLLPASGPDRRCEDVGLALDVRVDTIDGVRERCALDQLSLRDLAGPAPGFHYDDFSPDVIDACGEDAPQRLLVRNVELPTGSSLEGRCTVGTAACGLTVEPLDAGAEAGR